MSMTYSDHVYSNACEKILHHFENSLEFDEVEFLKLMQDELCKEIDHLKEQLDYYSNKINVRNYVALTKENTQLKARIKELEQYINLTENFPYQSKTNAELEALHSNAIEARDWFTCDLIANEKYRRTELLKETNK